jgi:hypothetical protein
MTMHAALLDDAHRHYALRHRLTLLAPSDILSPPNVLPAEDHDPTRLTQRYHDFEALVARFGTHFAQVAGDHPDLRRLRREACAALMQDGVRVTPMSLAARAYLDRTDAQIAPRYQLAVGFAHFPGPHGGQWRPHAWLTPAADTARHPGPVHEISDERPSAYYGFILIESQADDEFGTPFVNWHLTPDTDRPGPLPA